MANMMAQQIKAHVQTTAVGSIFGTYGEREEPAPKSCPPSPFLTAHIHSKHPPTHT